MTKRAKAVHRGMLFAFFFVCSPTCFAASSSANLTVAITPPPLTINLQDVGLKSILTTGSMTAGTNQLHLPASAGFAVGDGIIVAVGGEAGGGLKGTLGVGGTWPAQSYATVSAMNADTSKPINTYAWVAATGDVYQWSGSSWTINDPSWWYFNKALPKALVTTVVAVANGGTVLTLNATAATTTTQANVYFDNQTVFNNVFGDPSKGDGWTVAFPQGSYAIGDQLLFDNRTGWTLHGATKDTSTIFSPAGTPSAMIHIGSSDNTTIRDMHLLGNAGNDRYGLQWGPNDNEMTETSINIGRNVPSGFFFSTSNNGIVQDVKITDAFQQGTVSSLSSNLRVIRAQQIITQPRRMYLSWMFEFADSTGGSCTDCSIDSNYLTNGFESFRSRDIQYIRPVGRNASFATNGSGNFLIQDAQLTFNANSQLDEAGFSKFNPIFDINNNIQDNTLTPLGGTISNAVMVQQGYINATNDMLRGIVINVLNITADRGSYTAPNWQSPGANGPWGVDSVAPNTHLSNFTVVGTQRPGDPNISVTGGGGSTITNCTAQVIVGP